MTTRQVITKRASATSVVALCFVIVVFDGYDLVVYGATVPSLLDYQNWTLTPEQAGNIGSYALVGMLLGALLSGWLAPRIGARRIILGSLISFSVLMGLAAFAPTPELFGLFRFLGGLGLGGVVPTVIALTVEYSPPSRRQINNALMYSGYSVGGVAAAIAALAVLPENSFRIMYAIGMLPLFTVVPLAWRLLPESIAYLAASGESDRADALRARYGIDPPATPTPKSQTMRELLTGPRRFALAMFVVASFCGLLLVYGINTWLPNIMREVGYSLGSSLTFLLVLNAGAIVGALVASRMADQLGSKPVTLASFGIAVVAILALSVGLPLAGALAVVAVAGLGSVGTQILVNGYVATFFNQNERTSALGLTLGLGRIGAIFGPILGGWLAGSALGVDWNFYAFAAFAALGALAILLVPRTVGPSGRDPSGKPPAISQPIHSLGQPFATDVNKEIS